MKTLQERHTHFIAEETEARDIKDKVGRARIGK